ncbi:PEP-utilizing enzyme [Actinophytocola sp.]|uniref:PEP-utilizing enzyme n=1 Tax=Actinophytocola sp. TaxID=1872138 RepID=UPI002ED26439
MMRVLVNGVTSDLGRAFARALSGAGHEIIGVGTAEHRDLPPDVSFTQGDAATAESLVAGTDVVVHLSPVEREVPESGGIPALRRMATAAARHGIRFVVPIEHGPDAADADKVVRDSGGRHVVVRTAPLGGRLLDWQSCRTVATLLAAPRDTQWRLLHTDDLVRFLLYAVTSDRTGVVALFASDVIVAGAVREVLRGLSVRGIPNWPAMSTSDRKGTARDWGFECGWTSEEVVEDLARGGRGRRLTKDGAVDDLTRLPIPVEPLPRRRPPEDGTPLASVALPSMAAECDDRIDPRYPVFSAHQTAELFPAPLTPLSIDVHTAGLRAAGRTMAGVAGLTGPVADEWESRGYAVFGHRLYAGVSAAAAAPLPGWTEETLVRAHVDPREDLDLFPLGRPTVPSGLRGLAARLSAWKRFVGMARRYRAAVKDFADAAVAERLEDDFVTRPDAELAVRARLLYDRLAEGWTLTQLGVLVAHVAGGPLRRRAKADVAALGRGADIAHEPTFPAVLGLAEMLRADEELRVLAEWGDPDAVRQKSPEFRAAFDEALTRIGHRGPNEAELAGSPFAERSDLVFMAALCASRARPEAVPAPAVEDPSPEADDASAESISDESVVDAAAPVKGKRKFVEKLAIAGQRQRELAIDATIRYTGELRRLVREWGRRQVHAGRLVDVDDAFFLTLDELLGQPADALKRVERRRADWSRLSEVRMPAVIGGSWRPEVVDYPTPEGKQLHGVGVSAGVVSGPVRLLTDARANVEPGEVVVVRVVDVGHAALLGPAAAIVTDLGGPLSRAAIVARELGVPCVTGTRDASARLAPGTLVQVDGVTGDVTVLTPASVRA